LYYYEQGIEVGENQQAPILPPAHDDPTYTMNLSPPTLPPVIPEHDEPPYNLNVPPPTMPPVIPETLNPTMYATLPPTTGHNVSATYYLSAYGTGGRN